MSRTYRNIDRYRPRDTVRVSSPVRVAAGRSPVDQLLCEHRTCNQAGIILPFRGVSLLEAPVYCEVHRSQIA